MNFFWLKLFSIVMAVALSFSVLLSWFFADLGSQNFNRQSQSYLSKEFSFLYRDIQFSLTKNTLPSFAHLQEIISVYSSKGSASSKKGSASSKKGSASSKKGSASSKKGSEHSKKGSENSKLFHKLESPFQISIIDESGLVLAHSEPSYTRKVLSRSSHFLSLIRKYPEGWNQIDNTSSRSVITIAKPVVTSSTRYFVIVHQPAKKATDFFVSYLKWALLFGNVFFVVLFFVLFLYLKSFVVALDFLLRIFGARSFLQKVRRGALKSLSFPKDSEQRTALSHLARTGNTYLKSIRPRLVSFLKENQRTQEKISLSELSFSDIVEKAVFQSRLLYPDLKIEREIVADIKLPVLADKLFQVLWELIKNGVQAFSEEQTEETSLGEGDKRKAEQVRNGLTKGDSSAKKSFQKKCLKIRTFKKQNTWFCCEVEDEGPGMDKAMMEKASQLYFTTKKSSTGLGLPFIQSVLSRIGGIMKMQSSKKNGLKVSLFIPLDYIDHIQFLKGDRLKSSGAEDSKRAKNRNIDTELELSKKSEHTPAPEQVPEHTLAPVQEQ